MIELAQFRFGEIKIKDKKGYEIIIREFRREDREKLIEMYLTFDPCQRCLGLPPVTREAVEKWVDDLNSKGISIVAEFDGKIVGHLAIVPYGDSSVDISIFVHQDYQNRGIGQGMLRSAIDFCKRCGFKCITLATELNNRRALHIYKKLGFKKLNVYGCELEMYLPLN